MLVGIRLLPACWIRLQSALLLARNRLRKNDISDSISLPIEAFLDTVKRGSKKFRIILERKFTTGSDPSNLPTVQTFTNLSNTPAPALETLKKAIGLWKWSWLSNDMRNFIYLLRNNGLMLNNCLNAFDPTISPICTILDRDTRHRDGHAHFFMECAITSRLLNVWGSKFEPQVSLVNPGFFSLYWYGIPPDGGGNQSCLTY